MPAHRIASSTLWQLGSQITMAALSILTVKFVAVGLSRELAGNYNSAYGFLQMFGILADFGLYAVAVREMSQAGSPGTRAELSAGRSREKVLGALIVLRVITLALSLAAALFLVWMLPAWRGTPLPFAVTVASLVPFFTLLAGIVRTVFQVSYKMHYVFIAEVTQRVVAVLLIGAFIALGVRGSTDLRHLYFFLLFGGIGAFVLFILSLSFASRIGTLRPNFDRALLKRLSLAAMPFGVAYLCTALYREFDVTLIALLRPDFEIQNAYYGFVVRIMGMGFLIPTFLLNSTLPMLSRTACRKHALDDGNDDSRLLGKTLFIVLILGTVSFLFALLWARPVMQLLTTDAYLATGAQPGSDTALAILSAPLLLTGFVTYGFYVLLHLHAWRRLVALLAAGAGVSIALNLLLIPRYGFTGAALTSVAVHTFITILLLPQAIRLLPPALPAGWLRAWAIFAASLAAFLWLMRPLLVNEAATAIGLAAAGAWMGVIALLARMQRVIRG